MLRILRNKKIAKKIWIGLAIIIIPAFALWGFGGAARSREESASAGKMFGRNISFVDLKEAVSAVKTSALIQFGDQLPQVEKYLNYEQQAKERLILLHVAKARRIKADNQEVIQTIQEAPYFQSKAGFNNKVYLETLRYVFRLQPRIFEEQIRQSIILSKLYKQITDKVKITDAELRDEFMKTNAELSIYYIAALYEDLGKKIRPTQEEITNYYNKNKEMFKGAASINLEYIIINTDEQKDKVAALTGKNFDLGKISTELGIIKNETGLFKLSSPPTNVGLSKETLTSMLNAKIGQPIAPIQMGKAYYVYALKDKQEELVAPLKEVSDKIKNNIIREKSEKMAQEKMVLYTEKLKTEPFEKISNTSDADLKIGQTAFFKATDQIKELGPAGMFWDNARKLKDNQASNVLTNRAGLYIIKLKELKPLDEEKFAKEKNALSEKMLPQKKNEVFTKFVEETKKKAQ